MQKIARRRVLEAERDARSPTFSDSPGEYLAELVCAVGCAGLPAGFDYASPSTNRDVDEDDGFERRARAGVRESIARRPPRRRYEAPELNDDARPGAPGDGPPVIDVELTVER